jgi:sulfane dehydrogenase subunit SoxC
VTGAKNQENFVKDISRLQNLNGTNQGGQYWRYRTFITPVEDFFIRNEYPTPRAALDKRVDPRFWSLKIHGDAVEREITITYEDLLKMPSRTIVSTMECAGNGRSLFWEQQDMLTEPTKVGGTGWGLGGVGQAEWEYVPMSHILGLVGLKKSAKAALLWSGVDAKETGKTSDTGRPVPIEMLTLRGDSVGLAFKMNGQDLPPDHGAPVRALVPGWCGAASTKWLTEIKIASHDFWVRLNSTAHVMIGPNYPPPKPKATDEFRFVKPEQVRGQAVTWSPPRSLLTVPLVLEKQPKIPHNYVLNAGERPLLRSGTQTMRGYAWAPQNGVKRVDVRINGSAWQQVRIVDPPHNRYAWRRFEFDWNPMPGDHMIETRTTDISGNVQPATVPFNEGGFDFWGIPQFHMRVA